MIVSISIFVFLACWSGLVLMAARVAWRRSAPPSGQTFAAPSRGRNVRGSGSLPETPLNDHGNPQFVDSLKRKRTCGGRLQQNIYFVPRERLASFLMAIAPTIRRVK